MTFKFLRKYLPDADEVRSKRWVAMFGGLLNHPNLWQLNRSSVPGAVAIGLFAGLIPGPLQMLGAALLAVPLRKNLPVALLMTLYTNPFTIVPLYILAYRYGKLLLGERHNGPSVQPFDFDWSNFLGSMHGLYEWMLALGKPLGLGLVALALTLATLGYFSVLIGWRIYVGLAWRRRCRRRQLARR
jgi:uncharacterized protein (DUF2062 family)